LLTFGRTDLVGIVGLSCSGISSFVDRCVNRKAKAGSLNSQRTRSVQLHKAANSNYLIAEFPGSNDICPRIANNLKEGARLLGVLVVVLNFDAVRTEDTNALLEIVAEQQQPCLICLNKADLKYRTESVKEPDSLLLRMVSMCNTEERLQQIRRDFIAEFKEKKEFVESEVRLLKELASSCIVNEAPQF
jgi:GTPase Era involved in 16S rRNA processing